MRKTLTLAAFGLMSITLSGCDLLDSDSIACDTVAGWSAEYGEDAPDLSGFGLSDDSIVCGQVICEDPYGFLLASDAWEGEKVIMASGASMDEALACAEFYYSGSSEGDDTGLFGDAGEPADTDTGSDGGTSDGGTDTGDGGSSDGGTSDGGTDTGDGGDSDGGTDDGGTEDVDSDGFTADTDCDDTDASVNPDASETCDDGIDQNCDGVDGNLEDEVTYHPDSDGDGYGDPSGTPVAAYCGAPSGYVEDNTDCDDTDAAEGEATTWYLDSDGDGYGDPDSSVTSCEEPGYVIDGTDCDDDDATATDDCDSDVADTDGDGSVSNQEWTDYNCDSSEVGICLEDADSSLTEVEVWAANISTWDWDLWYGGSDVLFTWTPSGDQCACFAADADDEIYVNGAASGVSDPWLVYGPDDGDSYAEAVIYNGDQTCDEQDNGAGGGNFGCDD